jgi:uncharacterized protein YecE (DUF72 family)
MRIVACSGFPIAVSRYFADFLAVEVSDTELGIPGTGSLRRWRREAREGFVFTALAPGAIGESGFAGGKTNADLVEAVVTFCGKLESEALVFRVPEEVAYTRTIGSRCKRLFGELAERDLGMHLVLDAPTWSAADRRKAVGGTAALVARDPLEEGPIIDEAEVAYLTLPGPAGHRSRYDEEALGRIAEAVESCEAERIYVVFRNIDMETNARDLTALLEGE